MEGVDLVPTFIAQARRRFPAFDEALRQRLPALATDGTFVDDNQFDILLARRTSSQHHC